MFIAHWKNFIIIFDKILSNNIIKIQGEFMEVDDSGAHIFSFSIKKIASDKTVIQ